jgi:hypothetical protein
MSYHKVKFCILSKVFILGFFCLSLLHSGVLESAFAEDPMIKEGVHEVHGYASDEVSEDLSTLRGLANEIVSFGKACGQACVTGGKRCMDKVGLDEKTALFCNIAKKVFFKMLQLSKLGVNIAFFVAELYSICYLIMVAGGVKLLWTIEKNIFGENNNDYYLPPGSGFELAQDAIYLVGPEEVC